MKGYVYTLSSKTPDNVYYIGSSVNPKIRLSQHKAESGIFEWDEKLQLYKKPPIDKSEFILSIIDEIDFVSRKELLDLEVYWIHQFYAWGFTIKNYIENTKHFRFGIKYEMNFEKAEEIRWSTESRKALAKKHGVSITTINSIINNQSWRIPNS